MSEQSAPDENESEPDATAVATTPDVDRDSAESTVGTGSMIGLGCLALLVALVVLAIAYRLLGGSW